MGCLPNRDAKKLRNQGENSLYLPHRLRMHIGEYHCMSEVFRITVADRLSIYLLHHGPAAFHMQHPSSVSNNHTTTYPLVSLATTVLATTALANFISFALAVFPPSPTIGNQKAIGTKSLYPYFLLN